MAILRLPENTRDAVLQLIGALVDNGAGPGKIEMLTDEGRVLAVLRFSKPAAGTIEDGTLTFSSITPGIPTSAGKVVEARIADADDFEVFRASVSDLSGAGVIKLSSTQLVPASPVSLQKFSVSMSDGTL